MKKNRSVSGVRPSFRQILLLIILFVILVAWISVDQLIFSTVFHRFLALVVLSIALLTGYFFLVKPLKPMKWAVFLSLWIGSAAVTVSLVRHVLLQFDFSIKSVLIWLVVFGSPLGAGLVYQWARKKPVH